MSFLKSLYEHLKTRKKYNTLLLKYEIAKEDLEKKQIELNTQRKINAKEKQIWESKLEEQEQIIIELKKKGVKKDVSKSKDGSSKVLGAK